MLKGRRLGSHQTSCNFQLSKRLENSISGVGRGHMLHRLIDVVQAMHQHSREGHLSVSKQVREMLLLWWRNGIGPGFYVTAHLWNKNLSWQDKQHFVSEGKYWKEMQKRNPPPYQMILYNKAVEKAIWTANGIPTPKYWGVFHPVRGRTSDNHPLRAADDLASLISRHNLTRLCFKNMEDYGGRGFRSFECRQTGQGVQCRKMGAEAWRDVPNFCQEEAGDFGPEGFLVEEYVEQHEWYRRMNPSSVNSLRIYVAWYDDQDEPEILGGFFRAGREGSAIDNVEGGGIYAGIDPETGRLQSTRLKVALCEPQMPNHPDSGYRIEGEILPLWEDAKTLVSEAMKCIPAMRAIGFDVAITPDGPVLLEANERSGYPAQVAVGLPPGKFARAVSH